MLRIISDLHLEHYVDHVDHIQLSIRPRASEDILILAGDIGYPFARHFTEFFREMATRWKHVLYVPGNHEYYTDHTKEQVDQRIAEVCEQWDNIHLLNRTGVEIDGQRFIGCTLWSTPSYEIARKLNDFRQVSNCTVDTMTSWHEIDRQWLQHNMQTGDVVITHFMPLQNSDLIAHGLPSRYAIGPLDEYFGNTDMRPLFDQAKLWISGHTHQPFDLTIGATRWVCNPHGYPGENSPVDLDLNVELP